MLGKCQTEKAKASGFSNYLACYFCIKTGDCTKLVWPFFPNTAASSNRLCTSIWCNCDCNCFPFAWTANEKGVL